MKNLKNRINKTASALATSIVISAALALPAISSAAVNTQAPTPLWTLNNFDQPESVVSDTRGQHLYVSNINGQPTELNGKGYISKLDVNGTVIKQQWLTGFDAPKGMAIQGDTLYVADMQQVHVVSLSKGKIVKRYQAPNANMLNDITIGDDGSVYVSDLLGGGIYRIESRIKHNKMAMWFNPTQLPHPNGLLWQDGSLLVASWGLGMNGDFTTKTPGSIYTVNTSKPSLVPVSGAQQMGNLDGLTSNGDDLYVSDWINGNLFKVSGNKHEKVLSLNPGLADISSHKGLLFAPMMMDGVVRAWKI
jgi:sugar lactone lactonase YvrE